MVQVIAEHFYQQGNFSVGDTFVREAGIPNGDGLKRPYIAMHSVLKEVRRTSSHCNQLSSYALHMSRHSCMMM